MRVTVVPADRLILVDGEGLQFAFAAPEGLHALQWQDASGHLEFTDGRPNQALTAADYESHVAPFVQAWQAEKARLDAEAEAAEVARLAEYNSESARFSRLRAERDARVAATDYLLMPDYPLSDEARAAVRDYRQTLRDLPSRDGAPWVGGEEATPWPDMPATLAVKVD